MVFDFVNLVQKFEFDPLSSAVCLEAFYEARIVPDSKAGIGCIAFSELVTHSTEVLHVGRCVVLSSVATKEAWLFSGL